MNDRPLRVASLTAAEVAESNAFEAQQRPGTDLASCLMCLNRRGTQCTALNHGHVPLELKHRCVHYRTKRAA